MKSIILAVALLSSTAFAGHGVQQVQQVQRVQKVVVRQQRVGLFQRLRQRQQVQRVQRVQRVQQVRVQHVQQFVAPQAVYVPQAFVAPYSPLRGLASQQSRLYVAPQQLNQGCGQQLQQQQHQVQQFNGGGCASFFKAH